MGFLKVRRRTFIVIAVILALSIIANGLLLWRVFVERKRVRNSVVPVTSADYYTRRLTLAENDRVLRQRYSYFVDSSVPLSVKGDLISDIDVKFVPQNPDYPTGCESAAAVMLLNYHGYNISLKEFIDKYLPTGEVYEKNGSRFGPDPSVVYAGDPSTAKEGWGCFAPVIESSMQRIFSLSNPEAEIPVYDISGESIYSLPVPTVIWVTQDYSEVKEVFQWQSHEKKQTYTFPRNEHAVLLVGQDSDYFYVLDPLKTQDKVAIKRTQLENCYDSMGRQAVTIIGDSTVIYDYHIEYSESIE